jgi:hypothetical protein
VKTGEDQSAHTPDSVITPSFPTHHTTAWQSYYKALRF